jgi:hypothetical protein
MAAAAERTAWFRPKKVLGHADNDERYEPVEVQDTTYIDGEVMAMHECLRQLEVLDVPARARVFAYLYSRLGPEIPK